MRDLKGIGDRMRAQELWWQEEVPRAPVPLHLYLFVPTKVRSVSLLWGMLAKHLFCYIKGTLSYKLTYSPSSDSELFISYTDADHASCPDTGRSTSGSAMGD